jgi:hypothetical protein
VDQSAQKVFDRAGVVRDDLYIQTNQPLSPCQQHAP